MNMAKMNLLFQAVNDENHADLIINNLQNDDIKSIYISTAFLRKSGMDVLYDAIKDSPAHTKKIFAGIRNGVTSTEGLHTAIESESDVYVVDPGSATTIFHPKIFLFQKEDSVSAIIGSANITFRGLYNNIEASSLINLKTSIAEDSTEIEKLIGFFSSLENSYPDNIYQINNKSDINKLEDKGLIVAESESTQAPIAKKELTKNKEDVTPPIALYRKTPPKKSAPPVTKPPTTGNPQTHTAPSEFQLIWESGPLKRRDLNIPNTEGTNPTGSMGLKKGNFEGIDHRHYFREEVFSYLDWSTHSGNPIWERTEAFFEIIIMGINYGTYELKISHNSNKESASYKQKNFMTQLHWEGIKEYIANENLLGRTLKLYRGDNNLFRIAID